MQHEISRSTSTSNPDCPAETVKAVLGGDPSETTQARGVRRWMLLAFGTISLATGVIGMFVPLLPTTCFLLFAAWCFAKSSPRLLQWMLHNRWFGEYLRDYRSGKGIPRAVKIGSLSILWVTIGASVLFAVSVLWVQALLIAIAIAVTAHVLTLKNSRATTAESGASRA